VRIIDVITPQGHVDSILSLAGQHSLDHWLDAEAADGRQTVHILVDAESSQKMLDGLQAILSGSDQVRIVVYEAEATLPAIPESVESGQKQDSGPTSSREELLNELEKNSRQNLNFFILVFLSTIVAAVGLVKDNVAVVIGAMVIAPLLGPNLSLALGTALGEKQLMWKSVKTNMTGLGLTLVLSLLIGFLWPVNFESRELLARTEVGLDSVALALASGAAAVLSLTTGLSSVLVGVMVAVALMPPAVTLGLMVSSGQLDLAGGALLLLTVNVVCLNFAANFVFFAQGIGPRTWHEKRRARFSMVASITFWLVALLILMAIIYWR
jgi:uncharacterized hydrophobic protein (TIGR00341 family)